MKTKKLHDWNLSYSQARELQERLACKVRHIPLKKRPRTIAGVDCAFSKDGKEILAAIVVLDFESFEVVETVSAQRAAAFPYIPGLLSFREAPVCLAAVEKLKKRPDVFMIDGQGIAHPRRLGLAAHLGLFLDKPTIGCAKSRLTGEFEEPPLEKGAYTLLRDRTNAKPAPKDTREAGSSPKGSGMAVSQNAIRNTQYETIGAVVRTRTNVKPVFVSVGNKCTLEDAVEITLRCATKYRLPEPTRLADQLVGRLKLQC